MQIWLRVKKGCLAFGRAPSGRRSILSVPLNGTADACDPPFFTCGRCLELVGVLDGGLRGQQLGGDRRRLAAAPDHVRDLLDLLSLAAGRVRLRHAVRGLRHLRRRWRLGLGRTEDRHHPGAVPSDFVPLAVGAGGLAAHGRVETVPVAVHAVGAVRHDREIRAVAVRSGTGEPIAVEETAGESAEAGGQAGLVHTAPPGPVDGRRDERFPHRDVDQKPLELFPAVFHGVPLCSCPTRCAQDG